MSEENRINTGHTEVRRWLRLLGPAILATGIIFTAIGLVSFFASFASIASSSTVQPEFPRYFGCAFIGMPLMFVGTVITAIAFQGAAMRYIAAETAPVSKDTFNYMAVETKPGIRDVFSAIREGLAGDTIACLNCNHENEQGSTYCEQCGKPMSTENLCAACNAKNDATARFCSACGKSL